MGAAPASDVCLSDIRLWPEPLPQLFSVGSGESRHAPALRRFPPLRKRPRRPETGGAAWDMGESGQNCRNWTTATAVKATTERLAHKSSRELRRRTRLSERRP